MHLLRYPKLKLSIMPISRNISNKLPLNRSMVSFPGKAGFSVRLSQRPKMWNLIKASYDDLPPEEGNDFPDFPAVFVNETDSSVSIEGRNGDGVLLDMLHCLNFLGAGLKVLVFMTKGSGFAAKFNYYEREGVTHIFNLMKETLLDMLLKYYLQDSNKIRSADYLLLNKKVPPVYFKRFLMTIHSTVDYTEMEVVTGKNPRFLAILLGKLGRCGYQAQHESLIVSGGTAKLNLVSEAGFKVVDPNELQSIRLIAVLTFLQVYPGLEFDLCEEQPFSGQLQLFVRFRMKVNDLGDKEDHSFFKVVALDQFDLLVCIVDEFDNLSIKVDFASMFSDGLVSTCHFKVSCAGSPLNIALKKILLSRLEIILKV